jgi:hypothetical protein
MYRKRERERECVCAHNIHMYIDIYKGVQHRRQVNASNLVKPTRENIQHIHTYIHTHVHTFTHIRDTGLSEFPD